MAVEAAGEAGSELYLCDAIPLGFSTYVDQMARRFAEHDNRRDMDGVAREARAHGIRTTQMVFHNPKPIAAALKVCREERSGCSCYSEPTAAVRSLVVQAPVRRLRRDASCLLWVAD